MLKGLLNVTNKQNTIKQLCCPSHLYKAKKKFGLCVSYLVFELCINVI